MPVTIQQHVEFDNGWDKGSPLHKIIEAWIDIMSCKTQGDAIAAMRQLDGRLRVVVIAVGDIYDDA